MKDALGHGSDPRGVAHQQGVESAGRTIKEIKTEMEPQIRAYFLQKIDEAATRRNWAGLPSSFEADAVKAVFGAIKPHFPPNAIRARVAASKATTFAGLRKIIAGN